MAHPAALGPLLLLLECTHVLAFSTPTAVRLPRSVVTEPARRAGLGIRAAEDEFVFGDAGTVSTETVEALQGEERELTEREKEIAALRAAEKFMKKDTGDAVCRVCGYKYLWKEGAPGLPRNTPFELVSDSWACPNCKSPKPFFDPVQIEIAGFEVNQAYGFGTNTWTESQKNLAIFGGLGLFFFLFLGGYALN